MDRNTKQKLEAAGWVFGDADQFLGLTDAESAFSGIEARARGLRPVQVDALEHTVDKAVREASKKLVRALDTQFGKLGR